MTQNPYETSLEPRLLSATPLELVVTLYDASISAVEDARRFLAEGAIRDRAAAVARAVDFLTELSQSLDHGVGGELSGKLAALYDYIQRRLLDANFRQTDDGLAEAERLLRTLREAWDEAARGMASAEPAPEEALVSASPESGAYRWSA